MEIHKRFIGVSGFFEKMPEADSANKMANQGNEPRTVVKKPSTQQSRIFDVIRERKCRWIGPTLRRDRFSIIRQALALNPQGKRKRGRPVTTWRRILDSELKTIRMSWEEAKQIAQDRGRGLCNRGNVHE